jgi:hypothetical protein
VTNDGTYYEYAVAATNAAGMSVPSPQSSPPVQGIAPPDQPAAPAASDTDPATGHGYDNAIHVTFTVPNGNGGAITSVEYGLNSQSAAGTWAGPFTAGASITQAASASNGTPYVAYVRGCNSLTCGPWSAASNQVTPYGPPAAPANVSASASGTTITYSWGGGAGNGRPLDHYVTCVDGQNCVNTTATSESRDYPPPPYSQGHSVTVYAVDSTGWQSAPAASNTATTPAQPSATVAVSIGNTEAGSSKYGGACAGNSGCVNFWVVASNFTPGKVLTYTCDQGGVWWTDTHAWGGATVTTDGNGNASFYTDCLHAKDGSTVTINVTDGARSASGSVRT